MIEKIPHYRAKCVADFRIAKPGSINLQEYADSFRDDKRIQELKAKYDATEKEGFNLTNAAYLSKLSRKISHEVERAVFPLRYVKYATSIFGSARISQDAPEFQEATQIARDLVSTAPISINTGGGPGIMKAANLGLTKAKEIRQKKNQKSVAKNVGLDIKLPFEEAVNKHLEATSPHSTFGPRLNEFADRSNSAISWDGGGGTDLENAFIYQLKQVGHLESDFPLILKRSAWESIQEAKHKAMHDNRVANNQPPLISSQDLTSITYADHPDEAVQAVLDHFEKWKKDVWSKLDEDSQERLSAT